MNEKEKKAQQDFAKKLKKNRRANETREQAKGNFVEHMIDVATLDKSKKMQEKVNEELKHIPKGAGPQNELRLLYNACRRHSLGKKVMPKQTAKEVLEGCISRLKDDYPDFQFLYDENFFNKRG